MKATKAFLYSAILGALAAGFVFIPSAAPANGDALILGTTNSATANTVLSTTGSPQGLEVDDTTASQTAIKADCSAGTDCWGVEAIGTGFGVIGRGASMQVGGAGVYGEATTSSNLGYGVHGFTTSSVADAAGVYGNITSNASGAAGVRGDNASTGANAIGVLGTITSTTPGGNSAAVRGVNNGTGGSGIGVWGSQAGSGVGVYGRAPQGIGAYGYSASGRGVVGSSSTGKAGYFLGNVQVTGTLTKGAGAFRIDDPLDPAHKYLQHSFVESPDMMNVYNGNARTGSKGYAVVKLPPYFQALNRTFRYQLTVVGHSFAQAIVWKQIANNRFTIRTNRPGVRVSWQVTGIRHDPYANAHRIQVVVRKPPFAQGTYLHPELYGQPPSKREPILPTGALRLR